MIKGFAAHSNKLKASRNQNFYDPFGGEFKIHTANHKKNQTQNLKPSIESCFLKGGNEYE